MITRKIKIPIYDINIEFYYGNCKEIRNVNKQYQFEEVEESFFGRCVWTKDMRRFVMMLRNDVNATPGDVAHECKHMVNFIFRANGMFLDADNDEAECYLLGWFIDQVHSIIKI